MQLDRLWTRVRGQLLLLANGATGKYDAKVAGAQSDAMGPPGVFKRDEVDELSRRWAKAKSETAKRAVLSAALVALFYDVPPAKREAALAFMPEQDRDQLRKLTVKAQRGTQDWKCTIAADPRTVRVVADTYGVSVGSVINYRRQFGKCPG